jgi:hypothetical protein
MAEGIFLCKVVIRLASRTVRFNGIGLSNQEYRQQERKMDLC